MLLIDADMQSNLTNSILDYDTKRHSIYDVMTGRRAAQEVIQPVGDNLDLIPSSLMMATIEPKLDSARNKAWILEEALIPLQDRYSYCLIDCSPSFSTMTCP